MSTSERNKLKNFIDYINDPLRMIDEDYQRIKWSISTRLNILDVTDKELDGLCSSFYDLFLKETNSYIAGYYEFRKSGAVPEWVIVLAKEMGGTPQEVYKGGFTFWENIEFPFTTETEKAFQFNAYQTKLKEYAEFSENDDIKFQTLEFLNKYIENKQLPEWAVKALYVYLYGFVGYEKIHDYTILKTYYQNAIEGIDYPDFWEITGALANSIRLKEFLKDWKQKAVIRKKRLEEDVEKMAIVKQAKKRPCGSRTDLYLTVIELAESANGKRISYQAAMNWVKAYEKQGYMLFEK